VKWVLIFFGPACQVASAIFCAWYTIRAIRKDAVLKYEHRKTVEASWVKAHAAVAQTTEAFQGSVSQMAEQLNAEVARSDRIECAVFGPTVMFGHETVARFRN
jgi:hypothetical protein